MTKIEAIKELQVGYLGDTEDLVQAKHIAINAIQKQIPKKIVRVKLRSTEWGSGFRCPECEAEQTETEFWGYGKSDKKITFCWGCGQKLDWSSEE